MILPFGSTTEVVNESEQPSRTYRLDIDDSASLGMIDGIEAVQQTVLHILNTNRGDHPIYSYSYGFDSSLLSINDRTAFQAEVIRRVQEALLQDDRITSVDGFQFDYSTETATVKFVVSTRFGEFSATKQVMTNV